VEETVARSQRIATSWDRLPDLPFPELASWSGADLAWLEQPVDPERDRQWIADLPKIELHCHLGGFATEGADLTAVQRAADFPDLLAPPAGMPPIPENWPRPASPIALSTYMRLGDAGGSRVLHDPGCLREHCRRLYAHVAGQNIRYAEIRCSPGNYAQAGRSPWNVLWDLCREFDAAAEEHLKSGGIPCRLNLLIVATRRESGDFRTAISRHLALALSASEHRERTAASACRVVGVDLAGYEDARTRAHYFREDFTAIHRCGLAVTVHAGENDGPEGIWSAVFDLNARRLGHALHLIDSPELMRSVADRGIAIEMCPYANLQIRGFHPMKRQDSDGFFPRYPLKRYLEAGIRATVNTDNIGISRASLTDNLLLAAELCPDLTRMDLLRLQRNAVDTSFLPAIERQQLASQIAREIRPPTA
jgi:adenosine deaminase